jgi:hypothetical protein
MSKKKVIGIISSLALVTGIGFYINDSIHNDNKAKPVESTKMSEDQLAQKKVAELNKRVTSGEEKILSQSAVFPELSKEEAFNQADLVVTGKVNKVDKEYMEGTDIPFTDFVFDVEKKWKGNVEKSDGSSSIEQITVTQDGNTTLEFNEHPLMEVNQEYILFLKKVINENNEEKLVMIGGPAGKFELENGVINQEMDTQLVNGQSEQEFIEKASEEELLSN